MRPRLAASILLAAATVLGTLFMRGPVLVISSDDGQLDRCWRVSAGEAVTLVFTNSMYGGEVRESFRIEDGSLVRIAFETDNAASAEYYAYDRHVETIAGGYRVDLPEEMFTSIPIRIDARGDYRLRIDDAEVSLSDGIEGTSGTVLRVESRSMIGRAMCR